VKQYDRSRIRWYSRATACEEGKPSILRTLSIVGILKDEREEGLSPTRIILEVPLVVPVPLQSPRGENSDADGNVGIR
jgi:hypothetical protein